MSKVIVPMWLVIFSGLAIASDWASGGGELIRDSENPWFIQNTRVVTYCTIYDAEHYAQTQERTQEILERAVSFWKEEFKHGLPTFEPKILVATQSFVKVPCPNGAADVDLVFQFGFLNPQQRAFVKDPTKYAALAVRTDYDKVNLRGKGFIYIAADSGPDRFQGYRIVESPWTFGDGGLLYWTIVHELGHVFGLSHTHQRGEDGNVMASDFIEIMMNGDKAQRFTTDLAVNSFFRVRSRASDRPFMYCASSKSMEILKEFFGINKAWRCFGKKLTAAGDGLEIWSISPAAPGDSVLIGMARFDKPGFTLFENAIHFWSPPGQFMFPKAARINTPAFHIQDIAASYRTESGSITRQMSILLDPRKNRPLTDDMKIGGVLNGRLYINLEEGV